MLTALIDRQVLAEVHGSSPAQVMALHGWGRSASDWRNVLTGLDALAPDLPGFGASPEPTESLTVAQYAAMLEPVAQGCAPIVLVGHSFGARVAVRLAALGPELVRGLVLTGAPIARVGSVRARPALSFRVLKALRRARLLPEARMEAARRRYGSDDYRNASPVMRGVLVRAVGEDYSDALVAIRRSEVPVRLVWGADDTVVPLAVAAKAAEEIGSAARLDTVIGSGHLLDSALSGQIRTAIDDLLQQW